MKHASPLLPAFVGLAIAGSVIQSAASSAVINTLNDVEHTDSLPTPPAGIVKTIPQPIGNAALWQEAVKLDDAHRAANGTTSYEYRKYYSQLAWLQTAENSSYTGSSYSVSSVSKALQKINNYPTQFNQPQAQDTAKTIVKISSQPQQTIRSFGASGAWWPNFLKDFPSVQQKNLSALLFNDDWLSLSGYRYNMGASGDNDSTPVGTPGRGVESFMKSNGSYDWTRDGPGIYYLRAAQAANVSITFFANAAPSALTSTKKSCGTYLDSSVTPRYVDYIKIVLVYWSNHGIKIDYISPINEPDNSFGKCQQEGMGVFKTNRAAVFQSLRSALATSASAAVKSIKIMGDETSQIASQALVEYKDWLPTALSSKSIDAIAVHMYDWPDDATLLNYAQTIKSFSSPNPPPPLRMTEVSTFKTASGQHAPWGWTGPSVMGAEYDPGMDSALDMARYIWQWLTLANAESFDWWTAVSNQLPCSPTRTPSCEATYNPSAGYNDGLIYIDGDYANTRDYNFYLTKRFWVFRHFAKFIRPGSVRYDISSEILPYGTVAIASNGADGIWNTVFVNRNATMQSITVKLPTLNAGGGEIIGVTQTTEKEDWAKIPVPVIKGDGTVALDLPARGIVSMQFTTAGARTATAN